MMCYSIFRDLQGVCLFSSQKLTIASQARRAEEKLAKFFVKIVKCHQCCQMLATCWRLFAIFYKFSSTECSFFDNIGNVSLMKAIIDVRSKTLHYDIWFFYIIVAHKRLIIDICIATKS